MSYNYISILPNTSTDTVVSLFNNIPVNSIRRYFVHGVMDGFPEEVSNGYYSLEIYKTSSVELAYSRIILVNNTTGALYTGRCNGTSIIWTGYTAVPTNSITITANTTNVALSNITLKTDSSNRSSSCYCYFTMAKALSAGTYCQIATFTGSGEPARGDMTIPVIVMNQSAVPYGTGIVIVGNGVMYLTSDITIATGSIIQGTSVYIK